jgi:hypothetical protein
MIQKCTNRMPATSLLRLLRGRKITARELLEEYRRETGDVSRSRPRMALLNLIETGKVKWGDGGEVSLG